MKIPGVSIMVGDVLGGLNRIPSNSVDLIVTSPPYNLQIDYECGWNDNQPWIQYYKWCEGWLRQCYRVLKPDGRMCLNHYLSCGSGKGGVNKAASIGRSAPLMELNDLMQRIGFHHHGVAVWDDATVSRLTAWGSWLSASAPYINSPYEGILLMYKESWKRLEKGKSTISKEDFIKGCSGVWKIKTERRKNVNHPAPFPVELPKLCIDLLSYEGDIVLDPFMGSGTTGVACVKTGRRFIGIELNPDYAKRAKQRIYRETKHGD